MFWNHLPLLKEDFSVDFFQGHEKQTSVLLGIPLSDLDIHLRVC